MTVLNKDSIFKEFGKNKKDTGSAESQIALFSKRIEHLSDHLKNNAKDFNTELKWLENEEIFSSTLRKQILKDTVI